MQLHPQMKAILDQAAAAGAKPFHSMTPVEARQAINGLLEAFKGTPESVAKSERREIPGPAGRIPVQIYTPEGKGPFPVLVYYHGGGWTIGETASWDPFSRSLCNASGCVVIAVEYRLAPEHKFPAPVEDCYAAADWASKNAASIGGDPQRVAVGGDSAGGNLAAAVSLMARDRGGPRLAFQLLIYPATDAALDTPSQQQFKDDGYILSRHDMVWFWGHYLRNDADKSNPYACPAQASDLRGLPPALVVTAGFDPLRDEGETYAARLQDAGVKCECVRYEGVTHGFVLFGTVLDEGRKAIADMGAALKKALAR
ncbi:MAG TPA: alpha/beta hydrolase [Candidatus Binataceae bacterium]|jgi:acetyl esterase|nr:alpha/beta hydrolase [Candidatus Binataceae bacterium]